MRRSIIFPIVFSLGLNLGLRLLTWIGLQEHYNYIHAHLKGSILPYVMWNASVSELVLKNDSRLKIVDPK